MREIPKEIIVCGHRYEIQVLDMSEGNVWGRISMNDEYIKIDNNLNPLRQWEVLGHELMHAFLDRAGLGSAKSIPFDAEQLCDFIGWQMGEMLSRESLEAKVAEPQRQPAGVTTTSVPKDAPCITITPEPATGVVCAPSVWSVP